MNFKDVKKQLVMESGVTLSTLAALAVGMWYLGTVSDDYDKKKALAESQAQAINSEVTSLHQKYEKIQKNTAMFNEVAAKNAAEGLSINRQLLKKKYDQYRAQYYLNNAKMNMGTIDERKEKVPRKTNVVVSSRVTLDFEALSDTDVYNFVQALQMDLPGVVQINNLDISRQNKVNDEMLRQIAEKGQADMVKVTLKFTWMGIKSLLAAAPPTNGTSNAPANP